MKAEKEKHSNINNHIKFALVLLAVGIPDEKSASCKYFA